MRYRRNRDRESLKELLKHVGMLNSSSNPFSRLTSANELIEFELRRRAKEVEQLTHGSFITYAGPIDDNAHAVLKQVLERIVPRKKRLVVQLETGGGFIESAERIARVFRHHHSTVDFIVTTYAMSAGTVLVMSGDNIYMDYSSTLGPIDPQIAKLGSPGYVPALGYLEQFDRLIRKSKTEGLTQAELNYLLSNFDPGELYQYEQARELSIALLKEWLVSYKFKNWKITETRKEKVTLAMKRERAAEIATKLNETERWHSHSRGISMAMARRDLKLQINDLENDQPLHDALREYNDLLLDYRMKLGHSLFVVDWVGGYHGH